MLAAELDGAADLPAALRRYAARRRVRTRQVQLMSAGRSAALHLPDGPAVAAPRRGPSPGDRGRPGLDPTATTSLAPRYRSTCAMLGGGGMTDPPSDVARRRRHGRAKREARRVILAGGGRDRRAGANAVCGGAGTAEQDSAVLGGGGIAADGSAVLGGRGMTEPNSEVACGGGRNRGTRPGFRRTRRRRQLIDPEQSGLSASRPHVLSGLGDRSPSSSPGCGPRTRLHAAHPATNSPVR